jgi:hypothetical protein
VAKNFPYMTSAKNLPEILAKIKTAGTPPKFTYEFLRANLGFGSSNDRTVLSVLKGLGFLTADGAPTDRYNQFRDAARSGSAVTAGLREGWAEIFLSDQRANERSPAQLVELFKGVAGVGEAVAKKMATTFKVLATQGDWKGVDEPDLQALGASSDAADAPPPEARATGLTLHHDIHVHLPPTSDVAVYTAIFRALRSELLD